jgi:hypothetical protein
MYGNITMKREILLFKRKKEGETDRIERKEEQN